MPEVRTFDFDKVNKLIKESDPYLQHYIKCLKEVSDGWERLLKDAMKKIRSHKTLPPFNQLWEKFNAYNQFKPVCEGFYELVKKELEEVS